MILIGIPTFNSAWSLKKTLDSIKHCKVDPRNLVIFVVDTKSSDKTISILKKYIRRNRGLFGQFLVKQLHRIEPFRYKNFMETSSNVNIINAHNTFRDYSMRYDMDTIILGSDNIMPPDAIPRLYKCKTDIAAGYTVTQLKHNKYILNVFNWDEEKKLYIPLKESEIGFSGLHEIMVPMKEYHEQPKPCSAAGSGLMLIKNKVFWKQQFQPWDGVHSMDVKFCQDALKNGFTVGYDPALWYDHLHYIYRKELNRKFLRLYIKGRRKTWY